MLLNHYNTNGKGKSRRRDNELLALWELLWCFLHIVAIFAFSRKNATKCGVYHTNSQRPELLHYEYLKYAVPFDAPETCHQLHDAGEGRSARAHLRRVHLRAGWPGRAGGSVRHCVPRVRTRLKVGDCARQHEAGRVKT